MLEKKYTKKLASLSLLTVLTSLSPLPPDRQILVFEKKGAKKFESLSLLTVVTSLSPLSPDRQIVRVAHRLRGHGHGGGRQERRHEGAPEHDIAVRLSHHRRPQRRQQLPHLRRRIRLLQEYIPWRKSGVHAA